MRYTTAINPTARESLLGPKGAIAATFSIGSEGQNVVLQRAGKKYSVHWSNIKRHTRHRGVDDGAKLPHYHYRDDGFKIWDAIEAYVSSIIHMFYADGTAVKDDQELQDFAKDLHSNGFPAYGGSSMGHDFPPCIVSRAELIEICTLIMFTGSAQHAAVNFGQYTYYSFVPNSPFTLHEPRPAEKGKLTYQELMKAFPKDKETKLITVLTNLLSAYSPDEVWHRTQTTSLYLKENVAVYKSEIMQPSLHFYDLFVLRYFWGATQLSCLWRMKVKLL